MSELQTLFVVFLIVFVLVALGLLLIVFLDYRNNIPDSFPVKIKFSDFKKWIALDYEIYTFNSGYSKWKFEEYTAIYDHVYHCYFGFFDYCKYRLFLKNVIHGKDKIIMNERCSEMVKSINKDYENYKQYQKGRS